MEGEKLNKSLAIFQGKKIRRVWHEGEWWFVIVDVIEILTNSANPRQYVKNMRNRDEELAKGWVRIEHTLLVETAGGKQGMSCSNTEGIFRIIQSVSSKRAEPFKRWLAKVGYERIQEIDDPELAQDRMKYLYEKKGYSKGWIDKRLRGIAVRQDLTDEWEKRGVEKGVEFAILTDEISKATFGFNTSEYKKFKGLKRENLRDHMTDLELIFSMLGEASTAEIERVQNPENFGEHRDAAHKGGEIAKGAREELEVETEKSIVSDENYLKITERAKREIVEEKI